MPHAHLPVSHLLKQLEHRRAQKNLRDRRPAWLSELIGKAAELFDPVCGVGRVGFDCQLTEAGWTAILYLGSDECIGGPDDGRTLPADFRFDIAGLQLLFERVDDLLFDAFPSIGAANGAGVPAGVRLTIRGTVAGQALQLHVHAVPPDSATPGFRRFPNGRRELND